MKVNGWQNGRDLFQQHEKGFSPKQNHQEYHLTICQTEKCDGIQLLKGFRFQHAVRKYHPSIVNLHLVYDYV